MSLLDNKIMRPLLRWRQTRTVPQNKVLEKEKNSRSKANRYEVTLVVLSLSYWLCNNFGLHTFEVYDCSYSFSYFRYSVLIIKVRSTEAGPGTYAQPPMSASGRQNQAGNRKHAGDGAFDKMCSGDFLHVRRNSGRGGAQR